IRYTVALPTSRVVKGARLRRVAVRKSLAKLAGLQRKKYDTSEVTRIKKPAEVKILIVKRRYPQASTPNSTCVNACAMDGNFVRSTIMMPNSSGAYARRRICAGKEERKTSGRAAPTTL